ncbi:hypothetical protein FRC05_002237 [Tulasnella sp. 425]|nr:hypothetical protein FRC05_002237 [Tulasnella sp. 425]
MSTWKYSDFDGRFGGFHGSKDSTGGVPTALVHITAPPPEDPQLSPVYEQADQEASPSKPWIAAVHLEASPRFATCTILLLIVVAVVAVQYKPAVEQLTSDVAEGVAAATYLVKSSADCLVGLKVLAEGIAHHAGDVWCMVVGGSSCIYRYKASMEYAQWLGNQKNVWPSAPRTTPRQDRPNPLPKTKELVDGMRRLGELVIDVDTERLISDAYFSVSRPNRGLGVPNWAQGLEELLPSLSEIKSSRDRTRSQISNILQSLSYQTGKYGFLSQRFEEPVSRFKAEIYRSVRERQDLYPTVLTVARETSGNVQTAIRHTQECVGQSQRLRGQSLALLSAARDWMQSVKQAHLSQGIWCRTLGGSRCVPEAEVIEVVASLNELVVAIGPTVTIVDQIRQQCDQLGSDLVSWMAAFNFTLGMGPDGKVSWEFAQPRVILDTLRDTVALAY